MGSEEPEIPVGAVKPLTNQTRIKILKLLNKRRYNISEISKLLELSKPLVLYHIRILEDAGYVRRVENGHKWVYYELTDVGKAVLKWRKIKIVISVFGAATLMSLAIGKIGQSAEIGGTNILPSLLIVVVSVVFLLVAYLVYSGKFSYHINLK